MKKKKVSKQKLLMVAVAMAQELIINNTLRTRSQRRKDGNETSPKATVETAMAQQVIVIIHKVF